MVVSLRRGLVGLSLLALTAALDSQAQAGPLAQALAPATGTVTTVSTPKGPLGAALLALGRQTGVQIVFSSRQVEGRQVPALEGRYSLEDALARLLDGSDLEAQRAGAGVLVIKPRGGLLPTASAMSPADPLAAVSADPVAATPAAQAEEPNLLSDCLLYTSPSPRD